MKSLSKIKSLDIIYRNLYKFRITQESKLHSRLTDCYH